MARLGPRTKGKGPRNLTRSGTGPQPRSPAMRASAARTPKVSLGKASAGFGNPPGGGAGGVSKATSPMAAAPNKIINKPKTGRPRRSTRLPQPRADFPSKI